MKFQDYSCAEIIHSILATFKQNSFVGAVVIYSASIYTAHIHAALDKRDR